MKVSVWMSAYNHEKYISDCLESVLKQKTNFDFEIILGEDNSDDRTREIVKEYNIRYPGKFKLFLPEKNIGMMEMDAATWRLCTGEYTALLNGDDYWTDENKLQIQVDFLEDNPDAVMCFHKATVLNETNGTSFETVYLEKTDTLAPESLLLGYNPVMTPTVMIRNIISVPDYYTELPYGDMPLYLLLSEKGKIKYIDKLMSVYRIHSGGQWQGESVYNNLLKDLKFYQIMNEKLNRKYEYQIEKIFSQRYFDLARIEIKNRRFNEAKQYIENISSEKSEFFINNREDVISLRKIIFEGEDLNIHEELLNREVKWKIN